MSKNPVDDAAEALRALSEKRNRRTAPAGLTGGLEEPEGDPKDPAVLKAIFRARVLRKMHEKNWNQSDLARASGMGRDSISTYLRENARSLPQPGNLARIAEALGCSVADLLPTASAVTGPRKEVPVQFEHAADGLYRVRINIPLPFSAVTELMQLVQPHVREAEDGLRAAQG